MNMTEWAIIRKYQDSTYALIANGLILCRMTQDQFDALIKDFETLSASVATVRDQPHFYFPDRSAAIRKSLEPGRTYELMSRWFSNFLSIMDQRHFDAVIKSLKTMRDGPGGLPSHDCHFPELTHPITG